MKILLRKVLVTAEPWWVLSIKTSKKDNNNSNFSTTSHDNANKKRKKEYSYG